MMRVVDRYPADGFFSGSRTLMVRSVPPGARLKSFRLVVIPIADANGTIGPGEEVLSFLTDAGFPVDVALDPENPDRQTGVSRSTGFGPPRWTEIAFSGFRTLSRVEGSDLTDAHLQVDVGGLFVEVDENGTIPAQDSDFQLPSNFSDLPGLSVQRIRLLAPNDAAPTPVVNELRLRAVASNLTVSIGAQPAVWARPGEVSGRVETAELAEFAQAALADATEEGGFITLPVTIKTDTTAELAIDVVAEFDTTASGLPEGLPEVTLDYAHDAVADAGDELLSVAVPDGMELDPALTRVEIAGTFEGSEITHGPLADRAPAASVRLPEGHAAAAPLSVSAETVTDAVDLLLSTQRRGAAVDIDLREDFDGKPGDVSLLARHATASLDVSRFAAPRWLNAALGQAVTLPPADPATGKPRIWVVLQAVAGPVDWHLNAASEPTAQMQTSENGGLSWRPARVEGVAGALDAGLRLRRASPVFRVPVRAEIGRDAEATELALDKFQPLGRVEFALDSRQFSGAVNSLLSHRREGACPIGEQLTNGDFADRDAGDVYVPDAWTVSEGSLSRESFFVRGLPGNQTVTLVRIGEPEGPAQSISQVFPVSPGCPYRLTFRGFRLSPGARVELIWRASDCSVARVDTLDPPLPLTSANTPVTGVAVSGLALLTIPAASLDALAPDGAEQAELRVVAEAGDVVFADAVSLFGGTAGLVNPDFREFVLSEKESERLRGWTVTPADATEEDGFVGRPTLAGLTLVNANTDGKRLALSQQVSVAPGTPFTAGLEAVIPAELGGGPPPAFGVVWLDGAQTATGAPLATSVVSGGAAVTRLAATVPEAAQTAEITIEIAPGAGLTIIAASADAQSPETVPVSFLSEAPGRLTVRDFTLGFRPAPAPVPPAFTATPCAPTPADRAPGDVCEPDPCFCSPDGDKVQVEAIAAPTPISVIDSLTPAVISATHAATPLLSAIHGLSPVSGTARLAEFATRLSRSRFAGAEFDDGSRERVETVGDARLPVAEINGVGEVRTTQLATLGIRTVADLARTTPDDLVRRLGYNRILARDLVAKAREMAGGIQPIS